MDTCPQCNRKLLSHASMRCNWCGAEINDEGYQQKAAQERAIYRAHESYRDAIESARAVNSSFTSVIWGSPLGAVSSLSANWAGRKRWEQAKFQAQQRAMQEYAATQQTPPNGGQPPQNNQGWPDVAPPQNQQPANPAGDQEPATSENEVRSMFRHLEL